MNLFINVHTLCNAETIYQDSAIGLTFSNKQSNAKIIETLMDCQIVRERSNDKIMATEYVSEL